MLVVPSLLIRNDISDLRNNISDLRKDRFDDKHESNINIIIFIIT